MCIAAVISAEEWDTVVLLSAQSHSTGALWQPHWDSGPRVIWEKTNKPKHCSTNPIIRLHPNLFSQKTQTFFPNSLGTLNMYVAFDHRPKRSSHPAGRAGDFRQGPLLRPDGRQRAATLRHEEQNRRNQNKIHTNTIHFAPLKFLLVRFRHRKYSQVLFFCLTWLIISVNGLPAEESPLSLSPGQSGPQLATGYPRFMKELGLRLNYSYMT